jgi:hypothetical protein
MQHHVICSIKFNTLGPHTSRRPFHTRLSRCWFHNARFTRSRHACSTNHRATVIQTKFRGTTERRRYETAKRGLVGLQTAFRRHRATQEFRGQKRAAVLIQAAIRR